MLRFALALLLSLVVAVGLIFFRQEVQERLRQFLEWAHNLGDVGALVLALVYIPAAVFLVPGSLLTLGAGFAFGVFRGSIAVSLGSTAAAAVAFVLGRFLARDWVEQRVRNSPKFRAIDQAVAEQGFKIVLLTRLSPVFPYNFLNYAFGLTKVRFRDYILASWVGMFPGTVMYVYLGSIASDLASAAAGARQTMPEEWALRVVGLLATIAVTLLVTRMARRALARELVVQDPANHISERSAP